MIPLHELLGRIRWDPEFGRGEFRVGYVDHQFEELVYVPLAELRPDAESRFCFEVTNEEGMVRSVPWHRVREVWKDGTLIWRREH
jgi:uncharacterized protein (UPF0248 family)